MLSHSDFLTQRRCGWRIYQPSVSLAALMALCLNTGSAFFGGEAFSQLSDPERNIGVRDRMRPDYDPQGISVGSFYFLPALGLDVVNDDNIFASPNNPKADTFFIVKPQVRLNSDWSTHAFNLHASADVLRYAHQTSENTEDYDVGVDGRYDIDQAFHLNGLLDYSDLTQPRTVSDLTVALARPLRYQYSHLTASASKTFNALQLVGSVDRSGFRYRDNADLNGNPVSEQALDRTVWIFTGRSAYLFNPDDSIFLQTTYNERFYDLGPPAAPANRNSHGVEIDVGTEFNITNLIRSSLQAGYLQQFFDGATETPPEPVIHGRIQWFVTGLTTVSFDVDRRFADSDNTGTLGYISLTGEGRVDHELYRNIILTVDGGYIKNEYSDIDRNDTIWSAGARATWLVNRIFRVECDYRHSQRSSFGFAAGTGFSDDRISLSFVAQ
jgi:hypothetical protein